MTADDCRGKFKNARKKGEQEPHDNQAATTFLVIMITIPPSFEFNTLNYHQH